MHEQRTRNTRVDHWLGNPVKRRSGCETILDPTGVHGGATISVTKILGVRGDFLAEAASQLLEWVRQNLWTVPAVSADDSSPCLNERAPGS